jgi:hypothetical protein
MDLKNPGILAHLNSSVSPNTSAPKMVPGRYDSVYEEGSQDYSLPYILAWMLPKPTWRHTSSCWQIGESLKKSQSEGYLLYWPDSKLNLDVYKLTREGVCGAFWLRPGDPPVEMTSGEEGQEEVIPEVLRGHL